MGIPVMIMGASGSGKSASMRNFKENEVGIINVSGKPLPFKNSLKTFNSDDYQAISGVLSKAKTKSIVIDDCQYLMANEFMRNAKVNGYQKFTDIGLNFWNLIQYVIKGMSQDSIVYFLAHTEKDADGHEKMKTIGKMLDEKITIEGLFTIVLKTVVQDGSYRFSTQTNGQDTVKSPMGMFDPMIENDLKFVDETIRSFYDLKSGDLNG